MGMFDTVRCEVDLPAHPPLPKDRYAWLQTKDFDCLGDTYTITRDGDLVGPFGRMNFHGLIQFYTLISEHHPQGKGDGTWWEFEAKFTDGKLVGIECVEISRCPFGGPRIPLYERAADPTNARP